MTADTKVNFRWHLFAAGFGKDGKFVAEVGEVIEDIVDLGAIDVASRGRQLANNALTNMISEKNNKKMFLQYNGRVWDLKLQGH